MCVCAALVISAAGVATGAWTPLFIEYGPTFTNATGFYYPSVVKQGGTYHMWVQNHSSGDDVWYTSSADGKTGWSAPAQATSGGSPITGWQNHPFVIDTGSNFRLYYSGSTRGINIMEADYATPTVWTPVAVDAVPRNLFHYDSAPSHRVSQWYDAYVYKYGDHYEGYFGGDYGQHYGTSPDGVTNWTPVNMLGTPVIQKGGSGEWDSYTMGQASVIRVADDEFHMYYGSGKSGDPKAYAAGIGYATSADGVNWTKDAGNPLFHISDGEAYRTKRSYTPRIFIDGNQALMYFSGQDNGTSAEAAGLATSAFPGGTSEAEFIPEPASATLLLLGLGGAILRRRRRKG